jgi:hypothetical protein
MKAKQKTRITAYEMEFMTRNTLGYTIKKDISKELNTEPILQRKLPNIKAIRCIMSTKCERKKNFRNYYKTTNRVGQEAGEGFLRNKWTNEAEGLNKWPNYLIAR